MSKTTIPESAVDSLLPVISQAVADWKAKNTPEDLKARVTKRLNANTDEIIFKLLGFNNGWNKWELDHCNGRSGESAAGDYLRKVQSEAIREWLESVEIPPMPVSLKKKYQTEFNSRYNAHVMQLIQRAAEDQANRDVNALLTEFTNFNQLSHHLQMMKLLDPSFVPGVTNAS